MFCPRLIAHLPQPFPHWNFKSLEIAWHIKQRKFSDLGFCFQMSLLIENGSEYGSGGEGVKVVGLRLT